MNDPNELPHILQASKPEQDATEEIERLRITDPHQQKFVRIRHHMNMVFDFNHTTEERVASLQAIRDILEEG